MTVAVDGESLTVADVVAVAREREPVSVPDRARERVRDARERVADVTDSGEAVYGINTGFGELVDVRIPPDRIEELQRNLVRSHSAGAGSELETELVRAMLVTRLNSLVRGYSGVREVVVDHLATLLNEGIHPVVRSRGSLGASGDLAPLAHLSLVLLGEGEADVEVGDGNAGTGDGGVGSDDNRVEPDAGANGATRRLDGEAALTEAGLEPLTLRAKEGLALINGTQLTLGAAALLVADAESLCRAADAAGALTTEVTMGTTASCDPAIHDLRPHAGQATSARTVRALAGDSEVVASHRNCDRVQDAYSIRCLPQVHGAVRDAVAHLRDAVAVELNSVTDNPLVFPRSEVDDRASGTDRAGVISGGNFHGEPLALRLDYLVGALTELGAISERRTDRVLNPNLQESHLPPFLADDTGVESGLMIAQYTAAALLNECRSVGRAASDNTPVSGGQEDHVSMSATGALDARGVLENVRTVLAVELCCGTEAVEYLPDDLDLGTGTAAVYETVREVFDPLASDRQLDEDVDAVDAVVDSGLLEDAVAAAIDEWPDRDAGSRPD